MCKIEIRFHCLRIKCGTIVEGDTFLQVEGKGLPVIRKFPAFCKAGNNLSIFIIHKSFIAQFCPDIVLNIHVQRIEGVKLGAYSSR